MKKHLQIYAILILGFVVYNTYFQVEDERVNTAINILYSSVLFLYIGYLAYVLLKKLKKNQKK